MTGAVPYLSIVIPAYREEGRISAMLETVIGFCSSWSKTYEILVVDDGSPDATAEVAKGFMPREPRLRVISYPKNRGKGYAIKTGMAEAKGGYILFADADNATPFEQVTALLAKVPEYDIVIGSRYLEGSDVKKKQPFIRRFMSRAGNFLFWMILGLRFTDTRCGFKLFTKHARDVIVPRLTLDRWGADTELLVIAKRHRLRVNEVPVIWYDRERGNIHPVRDSWQSLVEIFTILRSRNRGLYD